MVKGTSYRTKRRKIQNELNYLHTYKIQSSKSSNGGLVNNCFETEENISFLKSPILDEHLLSNNISTISTSNQECQFIENSNTFDV